MTYDDLRAFFGVLGLLIFIAMFVGVLIYTFWPGNRKRFERARRMPLDDDPDESSRRGKDGRE